METVRKVILTGHFGVGKTSLVSQFVHSKFSEKYLTTIGVKIDKKVVQIDQTQVKLMLWDIAGETSMLKVPQNYFAGAHGIIYVFDLTREETYEHIEEDLFELQKHHQELPFKVLANKSDLMNEDQIASIRTKIHTSFVQTSAKTGMNVEEVFYELSKEML